MTLNPSDLANQNQSVDFQYLDESTRDLILDLMDGDVEMVADLIDTHLETMTTLLADMEGGLESGDAHRLREAAHTMKSSNAQLGAIQLAGICQELETGAKQGDLTGAHDLVQRILREYHFTQVALISWKHHLYNG